MLKHIEGKKKYFSSSYCQPSLHGYYNFPYPVIAMSQQLKVVLSNFWAFSKSICNKLNAKIISNLSMRVENDVLLI